MLNLKFQASLWYIHPSLQVPAEQEYQHILFFTGGAENNSPESTQDIARYTWEYKNIIKLEKNGLVAKAGRPNSPSNRKGQTCS